MNILSRLVGKNRKQSRAAMAEDVARSRQMASRATARTTAEQDATRGRMEAELEGQRQQRQGPPPADG